MNKKSVIGIFGMMKYSYIILLILNTVSIHAEKEVVEFQIYDENNIIQKLEENDLYYLSYNQNLLGPYQQIDYFYLKELIDGKYIIQSLVLDNGEWKLLIKGEEFIISQIKKESDTNENDVPYTQTVGLNNKPLVFSKEMLANEPMIIKFDKNGIPAYSYEENGLFYAVYNNQRLGPYDSISTIFTQDMNGDIYYIYKKNVQDYLVKNGSVILNAENIEIRFDRNRNIYIQLYENDKSLIKYQDRIYGPYPGKAWMEFNDENDFYIWYYEDEKKNYIYNGVQYGPFYPTDFMNGFQKEYFQNGKLGFIYLANSNKMRINNVMLFFDGKVINVKDAVDNAILAARFNDDGSFIYFNGKTFFNEKDEVLGQYLLPKRQTPRQGNSITLVNTEFLFPNTRSITYITYDPDTQMRTLHFENNSSITYKIIHQISYNHNYNQYKSERFYIAGNQDDELFLYDNGQKIDGPLPLLPDYPNPFMLDNKIQIRFKDGSEFLYVIENDNIRRVDTSTHDFSNTAKSYLLHTWKNNNCIEVVIDGKKYVQIFGEGIFEGQLYNSDDYSIIYSIKEGELQMRIIPFE